MLTIRSRPVRPLVLQLLRVGYCQDAKAAAMQAIRNAERSAGEIAAAEAAADGGTTLLAAAEDGKFQPGQIAPPRKELIDLHGEPLKELRFPLGAIVECRLGEDKWLPGEIVGRLYREKDWPENRRAPYQVQIQGDGPKIFVPADVDECVRSALRFPVGSVVECYLGDAVGWSLGVVVKRYHVEASMEPGRWVPYQIRLEEAAVPPAGPITGSGAPSGGTLVWAPVDDDRCVRAWSGN